MWTRSFAREATVAALNAMDITSNTYLRLMVSGKADKEDLDALDERVGAAEMKLTEEAIVSTVTGSDQYKEDLAAIAATGSGPEFVVGTQTSYYRGVDRETQVLRRFTTDSRSPTGCLSHPGAT